MPRTPSELHRLVVDYALSRGRITPAEAQVLRGIRVSDPEPKPAASPEKPPKKKRSLRRPLG